MTALAPDEGQWRGRRGQPAGMGGLGALYPAWGPDFPAWESTVADQAPALAKRLPCAGLTGVRGRPAERPHCLACPAVPWPGRAKNLPGLSDCQVEYQRPGHV